MSAVFPTLVVLALLGLALWLWSISATHRVLAGWYGDLRQRMKLLEQRVEQLEKWQGGR